ncbi:hemerythrin domain-containing protein [Couchioplanes caeruleus]|uniref:Cation-binding protein n=2 Tax=Couchioplanes caeruleus TaxID=56438 RepID=A0A1K0FHX4_9ACTN|nr:hemerythrin domain-containing protein [Couchioplanes caeruleus]OJF12447.1 cation-binding protein [Couchioplanes caeruleus subsp. caeruleus]ROP34248.1 hemerythrin HHE cation binding domain-containing protein [Couchioplanes caeruleus]
MSVHLPPLPPVGGESTGPNVADVVSREHRELLALCDELISDGTAAGRRRALAQVVSAALSRHLSAEEQYVYPAVRAAVPDGDQLVIREIAEDRALLESLRLLEAAGDGERRERARDVERRLRRHADAAAGELLPLLQRMASAEELIRLGNRVELAEEAAPTRPHPGTPATPPWNKVVDPAVAIVDKVRDVAGGRTTYPQDL